MIFCIFLNTSYIIKNGNTTIMNSCFPILCPILCMPHHLYFKSTTKTYKNEQGILQRSDTAGISALTTLTK